MEMIFVSIAHLILIDIWQGPFFLFFIYSVPLSIYPLYIFTHKTNPEDIWLQNAQNATSARKDL